MGIMVFRRPLVTRHFCQAVMHQLLFSEGEVACELIARFGHDRDGESATFRREVYVNAFVKESCIYGLCRSCQLHDGDRGIAPIVRRYYVHYPVGNVTLRYG